MISNQQFVSAFAGALGRPALIPLPEFVWNFVFGEERAVMITKGQKVVPTRTLESGYKYRFVDTAAISSPSAFVCLSFLKKQSYEFVSHVIGPTIFFRCNFVFSF